MFPRSNTFPNKKDHQISPIIKWIIVLHSHSHTLKSARLPNHQSVLRAVETVAALTAVFLTARYLGWISERWRKRVTTRSTSGSCLISQTFASYPVHSAPRPQFLYSFLNVPSQFSFLREKHADHSGHAVYGMNRLRSLEHWDLGFESHSRHGCLCTFILCVGSGLATGWSPVQGVLPTVYGLRNWKCGQGPQGL
jgi:hypothetical protein